MTSFKVLSDSEKKSLMLKLNDQFGISEIVGSFITLGNDKVRLFTGNIDSNSLEKLGSIIHIEISGLYLLTIEKDGVRLSHDAAIILKSQISKGIVEINKSQELEWLKGQDVLLTKDQEKVYSEIKGFVVLRSDNEIVGCGKLGNDGRIRNFVPKERRVK